LRCPLKARCNALQKVQCTCKTSHLANARSPNWLLHSSGLCDILESTKLDLAVSLAGARSQADGGRLCQDLVMSSAAGLTRRSHVIR
jgi:hypothetical protein